MTLFLLLLEGFLSCLPRKIHLLFDLTSFISVLQFDLSCPFLQSEEVHLILFHAQKTQIYFSLKNLEKLVFINVPLYQSSQQRCLLRIRVSLISQCKFWLQISDQELSQVMNYFKQRHLRRLLNFQVTKCSGLLECFKSHRIFSFYQE